MVALAGSFGLMIAGVIYIVSNFHQYEECKDDYNITYSDSFINAPFWNEKLDVSYKNGTRLSIYNNNMRTCFSDRNSHLIGDDSSDSVKITTGDSIIEYRSDGIKATRNGIASDTSEIPKTITMNGNPIDAQNKTLVFSDASLMLSEYSERFKPQYE